MRDFSDLKQWVKPNSNEDPKVVLFSGSITPIPQNTDLQDWMPGSGSTVHARYVADQGGTDHIITTLTRGTADPRLVNVMSNSPLRVGKTQWSVAGHTEYCLIANALPTGIAFGTANDEWIISTWSTQVRPKEEMAIELMTWQRTHDYLTVVTAFGWQLYAI